MPILPKLSDPDLSRSPVKHAQGSLQLVVNEYNRAPLYHQLFLILRSKIHDREYPNASYLPSENKLAATYKVSRITAIRALNELAAQGLVVRERGRGTRVRFVSRGTVVRGPSRGRSNGHDAAATTNPRRLRNFSDVLREQDEADYHVFSFEKIAAPIEVAEALSLPAGGEVFRAVRLGHFEGKPYSYLTTYLPLEICRRWTKKDLEENAVITLLKRSGVTIDRIEESVTATLADAVSSRRLDVSAGSPLIKVVRIAFDIRRRPIENVTVLYRPDRFQYTVSMERRR